MTEFLGWNLTTVNALLVVVRLIHSGKMSMQAVRKINHQDAVAQLSRLVREAERRGNSLSLDTQMQIAKSVDAYKGDRGTYVKNVRAGINHPEKNLPTDMFRELLKEAGNRANALDVCLAEVVKHRKQLHSEYRSSLEAMNLAAACKGVEELILQVFQPKKLEGAKDEHSS